MGAGAQSDRFRIVLVGARNPLNIGAAARAMSNFGFLRLRVVNLYAVAFREARSAVGASSVLARAEEFGSVAEAVADCTLVVGATAARARELNHPQRDLAPAVRLMRQAAGPVALLFGSEKYGLSNQDLAHCHWLLRIPTREEHSSMNLGQAVAVCLYELARAGRPASTAKKPKRATAAEAERLTRALFEALVTSGYLKPGAEAAGEEKLRRLVRRLELQPADAELLLGMVRQMLWKMGAPR